MGSQQDDQSADQDHFSQAVMAWQHKEGRHHLPWQQTQNAYNIWLSEIMLQQTQVTTVLAYYQRFVTALPTVWDLAQASEQQVMSLWAGLGYYSRARNLHACAKAVCERFDGIFPHEIRLLESLPGIGRSTAGAIAAFAYGIHVPILDGNVKRVLARHFLIEGDPTSTETQKKLWAQAHAVLPKHTAGPGAIETYTQGMMDLGATLCTRHRAQCLLCPVHKTCQARLAGRVNELPSPKRKYIRPTEYWLMVCLLSRQGDAIWVEQRPARGIWGGLWMTPLIRMETPQSTLPDGAAAWGEPLVHDLTHKRLVLQPCRSFFEHVCPSDGQWFKWPLEPQSPVPVPLVKLSDREKTRKADIFY